MGQPQTMIPMGYIQGPRGMGTGWTTGMPAIGYGSVLAPPQPAQGPVGYYGQQSGLEALTGPSLASQYLGGTPTGAQYGIPDVTGQVPSVQPQGGGADWGGIANLIGSVTSAPQTMIPGGPIKPPSQQMAPVPQMQIDPQTGLIRWT